MHRSIRRSNAQVADFHERFVQTLTSRVGAYAAAESVSVLDLVNAPTRLDLAAASGATAGSGEGAGPWPVLAVTVGPAVLVGPVVSEVTVLTVPAAGGSGGDGGVGGTGGG